MCDIEIKIKQCEDEIAKLQDSLKKLKKQKESFELHHGDVFEKYFLSGCTRIVLLQNGEFVSKPLDNCGGPIVVGKHKILIHHKQEMYIKIYNKYEE